jgi:hypothetical protein
MLRTLVEKEAVFQAETRENGWRSHLAGSGYDPHLGSGLVKIGLDGLPAALIWAFVDDLKIHAPTKAKLIVALNAFMDLALQLGLTCQEVKTNLPLKFKNTAVSSTMWPLPGSPATLRIPEDKKEWGLAMMIHFLQAGESSLQLSHLTLAAVTGLLQSLVEATAPQRIGQTFLRRLYTTRPHEVEGERPVGAAFFYTRVALMPEDWLDLTWWEEALQLDISVQAFSSQQGTLKISFGDGSGSGMGGTVQILGHSGSCPTMEAWMLGTWHP